MDLFYFDDDTRLAASVPRFDSTLRFTVIFQWSPKSRTNFVRMPDNDQLQAVRPTVFAYAWIDFIGSRILRKKQRILESEIHEQTHLFELRGRKTFTYYSTCLADAIKNVPARLAPSEEWR